ncbi:hypothetical protein STRTUCAR8_02215 [Streptomyces turgidiscabies Car8]|uniref:Uncharacterized protein n=1 Tax=Streptomyces turgidiscabies (strain Car8) TaxID=698760 RepID=L7EW59_STRT8|nr:hypothetical protein STRTUCAR8_02215 [Streptomyces turgidiscabies Car8]
MSTIVLRFVAYVVVRGGWQCRRAYRRCRFLSEPIYGTGHTQAIGTQDARVPVDVRDA